MYWLCAWNNHDGSNNSDVQNSNQILLYPCWRMGWSSSTAVPWMWLVSGRLWVPQHRFYRAVSRCMFAIMGNLYLVVGSAGYRSCLWLQEEALGDKNNSSDLDAETAPVALAPSARKFFSKSPISPHILIAESANTAHTSGTGKPEPSDTRCPRIERSLQQLELCHGPFGCRLLAKVCAGNKNFLGAVSEGKGGAGEVSTSGEGYLRGLQWDEEIKEFTLWVL